MRRTVAPTPPPVRKGARPDRNAKPPAPAATPKEADVFGGAERNKDHGSPPRAPGRAKP